MHNLGRTRSANRRDHLLLTPDTFVRTPLPGMQRAAAIVHVSPATGAAFTQYTAELEPGGTLGPTPSHTPAQRFVYVLSGVVDLATDTSFQALSPGGYAYIPADLPTPSPRLQPRASPSLKKSTSHSRESLRQPSSSATKRPSRPPRSWAIPTFRSARSSPTNPPSTSPSTP